MKDGAPAPTDIEVEWQFDAIDMRPVERWLAALMDPAGGSQAGGPVAPKETGLGTAEAGVTATEARVTATEAGVEAAPGVEVTETGVDATETGVGAQGAVVAIPMTAKRLVDDYLDTEDWRVFRSGYVLRLRRAGGRSEVTLKDMAPSNAGLRQRVEITQPLPEARIESLGADGPAGRRIRALAGKRPLRRVLEVRTTRRLNDLEIGGEKVAEVALDETVIDAGDGQRPTRLRRVEVEVVPKWAQALAPLVERMRTSCGLQPAVLSKFEAGLLAAGIEVPGPADLGPTPLPPNPSLGDVAYVVLRRNMAAMLAHEPGTRLGEDPEELHDMRVATRRMRAALSLFGEALPVRAKHIREELGWLARTLGTVRDLDVQLDQLDEWVLQLPVEDKGALDELAGLLDRERDKAREELLSCLESRRYERLVSAYSTMLRQGPSKRSAGARAPAVAVVPDLVEARHRSAMRAAKRAQRSGVPDDFHLLRIRCKRLRYALEFVSEIYEGQTTKMVRRVVRLQDSLGLMQDARVAATQLHEMATSETAELSRATVFVMGGVAQRYRQEAERVSRCVPGHLKDLKGSTWHKVKILMEQKRFEFGALYGWPVQSRPAQAIGTDPEHEGRSTPHSSGGDSPS